MSRKSFEHKNNDRLEAAHTCSQNNMRALKQDSLCGCFYCLRVFAPSEITEWIVEDNEWNSGLSVLPQ